MKFKFFLLGALLMTLSNAQARTPIRVTANDGFLYFKMARQMCGGTIEVRDSTGEVVALRKIDHRHVYVDLFDKADGKYSVKIRTGETMLEFTCTIESRELHTKRKHHYINRTSDKFSDERVIRVV